MLPEPSDETTAPRDLTTEESGLGTFGPFGEIFAVGTPYRDEVTISARFLRILRFADSRATLVFADSLTVVVFPAPTAFEPPAVWTFSTY